MLCSRVVAGEVASAVACMVVSWAMHHLVTFGLLLESKVPSLKDLSYRIPYEG
jgi:hypothetical protein